MRNCILIILLILLPLLIKAEERVNPTITIDQDYIVSILGKEVSVYEDANNQLSITEVQQLPDESFQKVLDANFHYGLSKSAYWLRFDLENTDDQDRALTFEVVNPYLYKVRLYQFNDRDELVHADSTGTFNIFRARPRWHRNFQFPIDLKEGAKGSYYLYIAPFKYPLNFHIYLWDTATRMTDQQRYEDIVLTVFFFLCTIYLLILAIAISIIKIRYYWYYFVYVMIGTVIVFTDMGLGYYFLWGYYPYIQKVAFFVLANLYVIMGTLFIRAHFNTKSFHRRTDKALRIMSYIMIGLIPITLLFPNISVFYAHILSSVHYIMYIIICGLFFQLFFRSFFRSKKYLSGWFLFGFSLHGIGVLALILQYFNLLPKLTFADVFSGTNIHLTFYTAVTLMIGMLIEMIAVFYIAIARFKRMFEDSNQIVQQLAKQKELNMNALVIGTETERKRIAQELHDGLGVTLSTTKMKLNVLKDHINRENGAAKKVDEIIKDLDHSHQDLRSISHNLMPKSFSRQNLIPLVEELIKRSKSLDDQLTINFSKNDQFENVHQLAKIHLYRIIQELLNNVVKHARASQVNILMKVDEKQLHLMFEDNGTGFDVNRAMNRGVGLPNVKTRVSAMEGKVFVDSTKGNGAVISIEIPIKAIIEHPAIDSE